MLSLRSTRAPFARSRAALAFAAGLGAAALMSGCTGTPAGVEPMRDFRAEAFVGTWYAVARLDHPFEQGLTDVRATYRSRDDGTLAVFNRAWNPETCNWETVHGSARFMDDPTTARFGVTLSGGLIEGGLHVIDMDPAGQSWAMLGGPTRDYLWILSRTPQMAPEQRRTLLGDARDLGYPMERVSLIDQSGPVCADDR
jgi:apolipoprotein D and lipocalin family protein